MANTSRTIDLFNYYFRYKWAPDDFDDQQASFMAAIQSVPDALVGNAVLYGGEVTPSGGGPSMTLGVGAYVAAGLDGYMHINGGGNVVISAAHASLPRHDLIVSRPNVTNQEAINRPTAPYDTVYLKERQGAQLVVITGTAATDPGYPSTQSGDVVIAAVYVAPAATGITQTGISYNQRDYVGKNSLLLQDALQADTRLQPYRGTNHTLAIKPSQSRSAGAPKGFVYLKQGIASKYPRTAGAFTNSDVTVNFLNGQIGGGDGTSPDFTPVIPTSGNSIVATATLTVDDILHISFGTVGTFAQCVAGIENQVTSGAGCINVPDDEYVIAHCILSSYNGTGIADLRVIDARTPFAFVGAWETALDAAITAQQQAGAIATRNWHKFESAGGPSEALAWRAVCWSEELATWVAVGSSGTSRINYGVAAYSTWSAASGTGLSSNAWKDVVWCAGLNRFVAIADSGSNRIAYSGLGSASSWTVGSAAAANTWKAVCWAQDKTLLVAVSSDGTNRVMTSPDGINWTSRSAAAANSWTDVCYSPRLGRFVAVSTDGTNRAMYSDDGTTWTSSTLAVLTALSGVTWSEELGVFCAVGLTGSYTSADGINWSAVGDSVGTTNEIVWVPELRIFVAVTSATTVVSTSFDGLHWTTRPFTTHDTDLSGQVWDGICWSPKHSLLVAVANNGATYDLQMMHSG